MNTIIKFLYKRNRIKQLQARLESFEDCVAHRGNELGEERIVESLKEQIGILKGNGPWWLAGV